MKMKILNKKNPDFDCKDYEKLKRQYPELNKKTNDIEKSNQYLMQAIHKTLDQPDIKNVMKEQ